MRGHRERLGWLVALTATLWLALVPAANAYIDAGSTTVIFQAVVAGLAASGMFIKVYWRRITGFFRRDDDTADDADATAPTAATASTSEATDPAGVEAP